jgi:energy-coupling factor transporter transmembrane protein EcfT
MKRVMIFLGFILYATAIFFIQNPFLFLGVLVFNLLAMVVLKIKLAEAIENIGKILPFILLTVLINWILENYEYAFLVAIKLILVCNSTYIYAKTTSVREMAITIKNLCMPLKLWKVNLEDIEILVCISLSMIPILKKEYRQLKEASFAKGMEINLKNMKPILAKLMVSLMKRVNELEESMIEKGYGEV